MELKFNSQICTTVEQSKKLLELGVNPETADCHYLLMDDNWSMGFGFWEQPHHNVPTHYIPAWSLHRLFDIMYVHCHELKACENVYDAMIKRIEKTIEHNTHNEYYFNK